MNQVALLSKELPCVDLSFKKKVVIAYATLQELAFSIEKFADHVFFASAPDGDMMVIEIYDEAIVVVIAGEEGVDKPEDKTYENIDDFINEFEKQKNALTEEDIENKYFELDEEFIKPLPEKTFKEKTEDFFSLFIPKKDYLFTPLLIIINIAVFILMVISGVNFFEPDPQALVKWGANFLPLTLSGEWWRLFTACFLHAGIFHLALNMYALLYVGVLLEPIIGSKKFILAYILAGLAGSINSLFWHNFSAGVGASGAIFGMYGVFLALLTTKLIDKEIRGNLLGSMAFFVGYNLLNGIKGNIDNAAHIGGLVAGIVIGFSYYFLILKNISETKGNIALVVIAGIFLVGSAFALEEVPDDMLSYQTLMEEFTAHESEAIDFINNIANTPEEQILTLIETKGIKNWEKCIEICAKISDMDITEELQKQNAALLEYSGYRLAAFKLFQKAVEEDTDKYGPEMEAYNAKIDSLFKANKFGEGK